MAISNSKQQDTVASGMRLSYLKLAQYYDRVSVPLLKEASECALGNGDRGTYEVLQNLLKIDEQYSEENSSVGVCNN